MAVFVHQEGSAALSRRALSSHHAMPRRWPPIKMFSAAREHGSASLDLSALDWGYRSARRAVSRAGTQIISSLGCVAPGVSALLGGASAQSAERSSFHLVRTSTAFSSHCRLLCCCRAPPLHATPNPSLNRTRYGSCQRPRGALGYAAPRGRCHLPQRAG